MTGPIRVPNRKAISRRAVATGLGAIGASMLVPLEVAAQGAASGTVEISQIQVAFIVSGNLGSGRLNFQGRTLPFTIAGLGAGGFGASRIEAYGEVFNLTRTDRFPGFYVSARYGAAVGQTGVGGGELFLQNPHGVGMRLRSRRSGLALSLGADGIEIQFK